MLIDTVYHMTYVTCLLISLRRRNVCFLSIFARAHSLSTCCYGQHLDVSLRRTHGRVQSKGVGCPGHLLYIFKEDLIVFWSPDQCSKSSLCTQEISNCIGQVSMKSTENIQYISNVHTEFSSFLTCATLMLCNPHVVTSIMYFIYVSLCFVFFSSYWAHHTNVQTV